MRGMVRGVGGGLLVMVFAACSGNRGAQPAGERPTAAGASASITAEDLKNTHYTRVEQILARMPGVVVTRQGADYRIRIRGTRSFNADNEPLVVIDGVPVAQGAGPSALAGLEPSEIERIDVLKDAGGYGVRGAAGVILITTKRGR